MNKRLMAFWKYDTFPYVVGGEIDGFDSAGRASWKGTGFCIHPSTILAVVPYDDGLRYKAKIECWKEIYAKRIRQTTKDCEDGLGADLPFLVKK